MTATRRSGPGYGCCSLAVASQRRYRRGGRDHRRARLRQGLQGDRTVRFPMRRYPIPGRRGKEAGVGSPVPGKLYPVRWFDARADRMSILDPGRETRTRRTSCILSRRILQHAPMNRVFHIGKTGQTQIWIDDKPVFKSVTRHRSRIPVPRGGAMRSGSHRCSSGWGIPSGRRQVFASACCAR